MFLCKELERGDMTLKSIFTPTSSNSYDLLTSKVGSKILILSTLFYVTVLFSQRMFHTNVCELFVYSFGDVKIRVVALIRMNEPGLVLFFVGTVNI